MVSVQRIVLSLEILMLFAFAARLYQPKQSSAVGPSSQPVQHSHRNDPGVLTHWPFEQILAAASWHSSISGNRQHRLGNISISTHSTHREDACVACSGLHVRRWQVSRHQITRRRALIRNPERERKIERPRITWRRDLEAKKRDAAGNNWKRWLRTVMPSGIMLVAL